MLAACLLAIGGCSYVGQSDAAKDGATTQQAAATPAATPVSFDDLAPEFDILAWYAAREQRGDADLAHAAADETSEGDEAIEADSGRETVVKKPQRNSGKKSAEQAQAKTRAANKETANKETAGEAINDSASRSDETADARAAKVGTKRKAARAFDPAAHGALVATLEPRRVFVSHNPDKPFNPASLVKLATTLAALKRLGAEHRFAVRVFADGEVDSDGTLRGDLRFVGSMPTFNELAARAVADELKRQGIRRITGAINVSPDFCFNFSDSPERSAALLAVQLGLGGKRHTVIENQNGDPGASDAQSPRPTTTELFALRSQPLREMLLYMNTHSSNFVAHRIGDLIGGADGVRQFLIDEVNLPPAEVVLATTSGLEHNEMTARGLLATLRALAAETRAQGLRLVELMPVANERRSTLRRRLEGLPLKDAIVAKTGTLRDIDGGVANLAGVIDTEDAGEIAFVLLDQGTDLQSNRVLQDELLGAAVGERFRVLPVAVPQDRVLLDASGLVIESRNQLARASQ